jgi:hypothetical protein
MTPATLVESIRARGIELVTDGRRIGVRPAGVLTGEERQALKRHKAEVIRVLASDPPASSIPDLDARAVCQLFGVSLPDISTTARANEALAEAMLAGKIDPKDVTALHREVWAAVCALEWEISAATLKRTPRLIHGRPLGDWLNLDDVARLLREGAR